MVGRWDKRRQQQHVSDVKPGVTQGANMRHKERAASAAAAAHVNRNVLKRRRHKNDRRRQQRRRCETVNKLQLIAVLSLAAILSTSVPLSVHAQLAWSPIQVDSESEYLVPSDSSSVSIIGEN